MLSGAPRPQGPGTPHRRQVTQTITTVRHVCQAFGRNRDNPPSLGQLREFVAACDGLDDDVSVSVEKGHLDEGGRYSFTFSVRLIEPGGDPDEWGNLTTDGTTVHKDSYRRGVHDGQRHSSNDGDA